MLSRIASRSAAALGIPAKAMRTGRLVEAVTVSNRPSLPIAPISSAAYKRHLTYYFAEQIRAELGAK